MKSYRSVEEELWLLYVGLTRARDLLVLVHEKGQPTPWLDGLQAQWLQPGNGQLVLPDKTTLGLLPDGLRLRLHAGCPLQFSGVKP